MEDKIKEVNDFEDAEIVDDEDIDYSDEDLEAQKAEEESKEKEKTPEDDKSEDEVPNQEVEDEKAKQKEQNHINAERRKREKQEREEALKKEGYNKAVKESVDGLNPYTHKEIKDDVDMEIYLQMRELEKQGKDPITDYAEFVAEKSRKGREEEQLKKQQEDYATKDIEAFNKDFPDADVNKVLKDEHFSKFADGKLGNVPLSQVYKDFLEFESYYEKKADEESTEKAAKKFARTQSSMGSMTDNNSPKKKVSYKDMSDDEFRKLVEKAKAQSY